MGKEPDFCHLTWKVLPQPLCEDIFYFFYLFYLKPFLNALRTLLFMFYDIS